MATLKSTTKWHRWVHASVAGVVEALERLSCPCVIEGLDDRSTTWKDAVTNCELTINGPSVVRSGGGYEVTVGLSFVFSTDTHRDNDGYDRLDKVAVYSDWMNNCIEVKDCESDSPVLQFVLSPARDVQTIHLKPGDDDELIHDTVTGTFTAWVGD